MIQVLQFSEDKFRRDLRVVLAVFALAVACAGGGMLIGEESNTIQSTPKRAFLNVRGRTRGESKEVRLLREQAEQGYPDAQYDLSQRYSKGEGVPQDDKEAAKWLYIAAAQGYTHAQQDLAEQGDAEAQYNLGKTYATIDDETAIGWYRSAAEQGHAQAQFSLGWMYNYGHGVPQDYAEAAEWYRSAAEQGHAQAQFNLGWIYANGKGISQDYVEATKWYILAAKQENAQAQFNLGVIYANGKGVPQDYVKAAKWYIRAAEQGFAEAKTILARLVENSEKTQ